MRQPMIPLLQLNNLHTKSSILSPFYFLTSIRSVHHHMELEEPGGFERFIGIKRSNRNRANRHADMNERIFSRLRGQKRLIIELEDDIERREMQAMTSDQLRMYLLRKGKPNPYKDIYPREWHEHDMTIQSLGHSIMDNYLPSQKGLIEKLMKLEFRDIYDDTKSYVSKKYQDIQGNGLKGIRKKQGLQNFNLKEFAKESENIYISAFTALAKRERQKLHQLITETAFANLWPDMEKGTLRWEFCNFLEPSQVINVRCAEFPLKSGNSIAQITVRMHSEQKLAYYDKDGHLLLGLEDKPREVLEYNVFENHIASEEGKWRFHGRINPHWFEPKERINRPTLIENKELEELQPKKLRSSMSKHNEQSKKQYEEAEKNKFDGR